ncbi:N-acetylneuraminate synthase, partial [PVC group bacterium]|nr:N-acetylneuraminate synthase [PVC group bacterium]
KTWQEMINRSRELEESLGNGQKIIETNEEDTVIVQRRCLRLIRDMKAGEVIAQNDLEPLRPAPEDSVAPYELTNVIGKKISSPKTAGDALYWKDIND